MRLDSPELGNFAPDCGLRVQSVRISALVWLDTSPDWLGRFPFCQDVEPALSGLSPALDTGTHSRGDRLRAMPRLSLHTLECTSGH